MKEAVYDAVYEAIEDRNELMAVQVQFPAVDYDTLLAIWSIKYRQHSVLIVKAINETTEQRLYDRYSELCREFAGTPTNALLVLAAERNMPPYLLVRAVVQQCARLALSRSSSTRQTAPAEADGDTDTDTDLAAPGASRADPSRIKYLTSQWMDDPRQIPHKLLASQVTAAIRCDQFHSPEANMVRRIVGKEYEYRLHAFLRDRRIPFADEEVMRARNYEKTPDALLLVPCAVNGRIVHWIESKASFADRNRSLHKGNVEKQFLTYYNR